MMHAPVKCYLQPLQFERSQVWKPTKAIWLFHYDARLHHSSHWATLFMKLIAAVPVLLAIAYGQISRFPARTSTEIPTRTTTLLASRTSSPTSVSPEAEKSGLDSDQVLATQKGSESSIMFIYLAVVISLVAIGGIFAFAMLNRKRKPANVSAEGLVNSSNRKSTISTVSSTSVPKVAPSIDRVGPFYGERNNNRIKTESVVYDFRNKYA
jgi:flagellar biogenesis protein FliO